MQEFEKELEHETEQEKLKAEKTLSTLAKRKDKLLQVRICELYSMTVHVCSPVTEITFLG